MILENSTTCESEVLLLGKKVQGSINPVLFYFYPWPGPVLNPVVGEEIAPRFIQPVYNQHKSYLSRIELGLSVFKALLEIMGLKDTNI